jgi:hypothetical protein
MALGLMMTMQMHHSTIILWVHGPQMLEGSWVIRFS